MQPPLWHQFTFSMVPLGRWRTKHLTSLGWRRRRRRSDPTPDQTQPGRWEKPANPNRIEKDPPGIARGGGKGEKPTTANRGALPRSVRSCPLAWLGTTELIELCFPCSEPLRWITVYCLGSKIDCLHVDRKIRHFSHR
uniref:Uncharacterized protein n=1 Tax=Myotis myotis TaxID=51298 RepID=A0A7J7WHZ8_MYOMY|nr:hypothetical protein mMyoMyo1_012164 [Myotis myotis]